MPSTWQSQRLVLGAGSVIVSVWVLRRLLRRSQSASAEGVEVAASCELSRRPADISIVPGNACAVEKGSERQLLPPTQEPTESRIDEAEATLDGIFDFGSTGCAAPDGEDVTEAVQQFDSDDASRPVAFSWASESRPSTDGGHQQAFGDLDSAGGKDVCASFGGGDHSTLATLVREADCRPSTAVGRRHRGPAALNSDDVGIECRGVGDSALHPSISTGSSGQVGQKARRKNADKKESLFAKGFLNKPARKSAGRQDGSVDGSEGSEAPRSSSHRPESMQAAAGASDSDDVGKAALSVAHETISREQVAGVQFFHECRYREALAAFERMRDAARGAGVGREEGRAYRLLGNALDKLDAPEHEIEEAYKKALTIAHKQDDMELSFNVLTGMGSHAVKVGDLDLAEHFYLQSLTLARRVLSVNEVAVAEGNLGMCLGQSGSRSSESLDHFRKAIALQERVGKAGNPHSIVTLLANLAASLSAQGQHVEAQAEFERALTLADKLQDCRVKAKILTNLANLYDSELNEPEKARDCRKALAAIRNAAMDVGEVASTEVQICAICLEALEPSDASRQPVVVLSCQHAYHRACWDGCLPSESEERVRCPQCRGPNSFMAA